MQYVILDAYCSVTREAEASDVPCITYFHEKWTITVAYEAICSFHD